MASPMLPSLANSAQYPTVILAIVEQKENPKGHCCSRSLVEVDDDRVKGRQLSCVTDAATNDGTLLKFTELEAIAMEKGLKQEEHVTKTDRLASRTTSTAMLSAPMKLQFTNELVADKSDHLGNNMTIADA